MRVAVFGLGYVGSITSAFLASEGHSISGVDISVEKVDMVNQGMAPVHERGLSELIARVTSEHRLTATTDSASAVMESDVAVICVGTPSKSNGDINTSHVRDVAAQIGSALRQVERPYTVILRSTVIPGTTRDLVVPTIEATSGKAHNFDFEVCFNPEFLREGSALADFANPPKTVVGTSSGRPNDCVAQLYAWCDAPTLHTTYETAELAKYVDNSWHALKVVFANEVARISAAADIDSRDVMSIMTSDQKLNISPKYLRPGFAYGGSCLPKDVSALGHLTTRLKVTAPVLQSLASSNTEHVAKARELVASQGSNIGVLGISFKANTDDVRNSPAIDLMRQLIEGGNTVRSFDPNVSADSVVGANKQYLEDNLQVPNEIIVHSGRELVEAAEVIVLTKDEPALIEALDYLQPYQTLVDLVGIRDRPKCGNYIGIGW